MIPWLGDFFGSNNMDATFINSILFLGGAGFLFGAGLGYVAKKFATPINPTEEAIIKILPGANCGACGYPGCASYAEALAADLAPPGKCSVVSPEVNKEITRLVGKELVDSSRKTAVVFCAGGENCKDKFIYEGIASCSVAAGFFGGSKECGYGCLTLGDCYRSCLFGAISWQEGKVPEVDLEKCTACGVCIKVCPKKIIHLEECRFNYHIFCSSFDKGVRVRQICTHGCIGCGVCVKVCPKNDIILENNLAKMKYENCDNCGLCEQKCPTKSIVRTTAVVPVVS